MTTLLSDHWLANYTREWKASFDTSVLAFPGNGNLLMGGGGIEMYESIHQAFYVLLCVIHLGSLALVFVLKLLSIGEELTTAPFDQQSILLRCFIESKNVMPSPQYWCSINKRVLISFLLPWYTNMSAVPFQFESLRIDSICSIHPVFAYYLCM